MQSSIKIDELIEVVRRGGAVKTGVDVYNRRGVLLIQNNILLKSVNALLTLKQNGLVNIPVDYEMAGGAWDKHGDLIDVRKENRHKQDIEIEEEFLTETQQKIEEIKHIRKEANAVHQRAKQNIQKIIEQIRQTGGKFDQSIVESTVDEIFFLLTKKGNAFSYLAKELFEYDDYLYNHSVDVCTLGTAILLKFNEHFGEMINVQLNQMYIGNARMNMNGGGTSFIQYYPEELKEMAMGFFLHDIGKVSVIEQIVDNKGKLGRKEIELYKTHSYKLGHELLKKNGIHNALISNIVMYHHAALFQGETKSYPQTKLPIEIPPYVKICKLADSYDTLISKRSYKNADNPVSAVTGIFRNYAGKEDIMLQLVLHAFISVVGIYPIGSVIYLRNGQLAYIIDSAGPLYLPITDEDGNALKTPAEPINLSDVEEDEPGLTIDRRRPPLSPNETYGIIPDIFKQKK